jgi:hypothetical protein
LPRGSAQSLSLLRWTTASLGRAPLRTTMPPAARMVLPMTLARHSCQLSLCNKDCRHKNLKLRKIPGFEQCSTKVKRFQNVSRKHRFRTAGFVEMPGNNFPFFS